MTKNVVKIDNTVTQDCEFQPLISTKFPFVAFCFTFLATVMRPKQDVKDMNEHQEMEQYEDGNMWLEEAKQNFDLWFTRQQEGEVQTEHQRRVRLAEDIMHDVSCILRLSLTFIFYLPAVLVLHLLQRMHLFVARFSDILDVVITCDGCDTTLSGRRYRCLNCPDVDLCNNCYYGNYKSTKQTIF